MYASTTIDTESACAIQGEIPGLVRDVGGPQAAARVREFQGDVVEGRAVHTRVAGAVALPVWRQRVGMGWRVVSCRAAVAGGGRGRRTRG